MKAICFCLLLLTTAVCPLDAAPSGAQPLMRLDSDSFGAPRRYCRETTQKFGPLTAERLHFELHNKGVGGAIINDAWRRMLSPGSGQLPLPSAYALHVVNLGFNDMRKYGSRAFADREIANRLCAMAAYMRLESYRDQTDAAFRWTGEWTHSEAKSGDMIGSSCSFTCTPGASVSVDFTGSRVTVGTFGVRRMGGKLEIAVDGKVRKTLDLNHQCSGAYAPIAVELDGFSQGPHTLTLRKADGPNTYVYVDYVGKRRDRTPLILINGMTRMVPECYRLPQWNQGSDAAAERCNRQLESQIASAFDGRVVYVSQDAFRHQQHVGSDRIHPNNAGHTLISDNLVKAYRAAPKGTPSAQ